MRGGFLSAARSLGSHRIAQSVPGGSGGSGGSGSGGSGGQPSHRAEGALALVGALEACRQVPEA